MQTTKEILLDVSDLEAPQPLIEAVRALDKLQENEVLIFQHRMSPKHLFHEIEIRNFTYEILKDEPNNFIMKIYKG